MALCTQSDVEQRLQWDITAEPEPVVTNLITAAQSIIESVLGRHVEHATGRTETFDGGPVALFLKHWPVTDVTAVTEDGTSLVEGTDFQWKDNGRIIRITSAGHQRYWNTTKPQSIVVTYDGGYQTGVHDSELNTLSSVCTEMVARAFRRGAANAALPAGAAGGIQSVTLNDAGTVTYATGSGAATVKGGVEQFLLLTDDELFLLGQFDRFRIGFA